MNHTQETQLMLLLSDYVAVLDGDTVMAISPEATTLTRQKVITDLTEEQNSFSTDERSIADWQEENIALLESITDETFHQVLTEKIAITQVQIGHSLFEPLNQYQLEQLAQKLNLSREKATKTISQIDSKPKGFLKLFRQR